MKTILAHYPGMFFQFTLANEKKVQPKVTDIMWIPLFAAIVVGYIVIAAIDINDGVRHGIFKLDFDVKKNYLIAAGASLGTAVLLALMYTFIVHRLAKLFIIIALVIHTTISLGLSVYYGVVQDCYNTFICAFATFMGILFFPLFYWRIREASQQWFAAVNIAFRHPSIFPAGFGLLIAALGLAVLTGFSIFANARPLPEFLASTIFTVFGGYFQITLAKNIVRAAVACVYGASWFKQSHMCPLVFGLRTSLSYSLGSLVAVSFFVALSNVASYSFPFLVDVLEPEPSLIAMCSSAGTLLTAFDWIFQILSLYTSIYIAVYNRSYVRALHSSLGFLAQNIVNEALTGGIFLVLCRSVGKMASFVAYVYLRSTNTQSPLLVHFVDMASSQLCSVMLSPIIIGVQTLAVLTQESPGY